MIDPHVFTQRFALLLGRFDREMPEPVTREYFKFLNAELSTGEFEAASKIIFNEDQFWPSPRRFVDAVRGNVKELAASEWQEVLRLAQGGITDLSSLTAQGQVALRAAGGWRAVAYAEGDYALGRMRKQFAEAYEHAGNAKARPQLEKPEPVVFEALQ